MRFQMVARAEHPGFLDLPWHLPLAHWQSDRFVEVSHGIHRHVVRFVEYDGDVFALKELPDRVAEREYRLLRRLADARAPVVEVIGLISDRGDAVDAILITRHLRFSLPYRTLFSRGAIRDLQRRLLDALAGLLVELHLAGFFWGDCSLSNALFRRDAGELAAYLVDAETGQMELTLSDRMRRYDLDLAVENVAGELLDLQAGDRLPAGIDPIATARALADAYASLWDEVTRIDVIQPGERFRIQARLQQLNDLGFDVDEVELLTVPEGYQLRLRTQVVEPGHHRRRLHTLTGLDVQENQARRLLYDLDEFRAEVESRQGHRLPDSVAAYRWLAEVFAPTIDAIPPELRAKLEPAEAYHQILDHRWFLSEAAGHDIGLGETVRSYVTNVLRFVPDEQRVLPEETAELPIVEQISTPDDELPSTT